MKQRKNKNEKPNDKAEGARDCGHGDGVSKVTATLSSWKDWTSFTFGSDVIRFRTSPKLVRYTNVRKWDAGYLEVGADYGHGEEEEYIDLVPILENLYYAPEKFLKPIEKVEVAYG